MASARAPIPFMDLGATRREMDGGLEAAAARAVASDWYLLGEELEAFEGAFAAYCETRHCVGVGTGLSAIELALRAGGIGAGDEVIVPAYTWIATWLAVSGAGATPVPVDAIGPGYNIDPEAIEAAITQRTAAIVPVHLLGEPADMEAIVALAGRHGLLVVEDAAQGHGARVGGRRVGGLGAAGAFSFYPSKNLGAIGNGGAVVTDDDELAAKLRLLRNYGMRNRYEIESEGVNSRLDEIQAAVLAAKLPRLDGWNAARASLAATYRERFADSEAIEMPEPPPWAENVWHLFVIGCEGRDRLADRLAAERIGSQVHYPLLPHETPPYEAGDWGPGSFPVAERLRARTLSLPMYPQLAPGDCEAVAEAVLAALAEA